MAERFADLVWRLDRILRRPGRRKVAVPVCRRRRFATAQPCPPSEPGERRLRRYLDVVRDRSKDARMGLPLRGRMAALEGVYGAGCRRPKTRLRVGRTWEPHSRPAFRRRDKKADEGGEAGSPVHPSIVSDLQVCFEGSHRSDHADPRFARFRTLRPAILGYVDHRCCCRCSRRRVGNASASSECGDMYAAVASAPRSRHTANGERLPSASASRRSLWMAIHAPIPSFARGRRQGCSCRLPRARSSGTDESDSAGSIGHRLPLPRRLPGDLSLSALILRLVLLVVVHRV